MMELDDLLHHNKEAAALFSHLPPAVQGHIRSTAGHINTLEALRDYTIRMVDHSGPFYAVRTEDGTCMEPELKAQWTMEHET